MQYPKIGNFNNTDRKKLHYYFVIFIITYLDNNLFHLIIYLLHILYLSF